MGVNTSPLPGHRAGGGKKRARKIVPAAVVIFSVLCVVACLHPGADQAAQDPGRGVAVLVLHQVAPDVKGNPYVLSPDEFVYLVEELQRRGYTFIDLPTFHACLAGKMEAPPAAVLLTFGDGYEGVYRYAHPVLVRHRIPAVMFPVAKWFTEPPAAGAWPHLSTEQAREMLASGLWAFGGHSFDGHRRVATAEGRARGVLTQPVVFPHGRMETRAEYRVRVWKDIQAANTWFLRHLGLVPQDFAPPYGDTSPDLNQLLRLAG